MIKTHRKAIITIVLLVLAVAGIAYAQFSVDSAGNVTATSINLIPKCSGYLYNTNGTLSCNPGTGGTGGGASIGPAVSATNEVAQTIPSGVSYLSFNDIVWDSGNFHPLTGDLTKFTAPSTGLYAASVSLFCNSGGVGFQIFFRVNGADVEGSGGAQTTASGNMNSLGGYQQMLSLNTGDVVQAATYLTGPCTTVPYYSTMQLTKLASNF